MSSIAVARAATKDESWREHLDAALAYIDVHPGATRNFTLCRLAGWLWRRWLSGDDVAALLLEVNRCVFQKPHAEVMNIARWIQRKPRDGGRRSLPDPELDRFLADVQKAIGAWDWHGRSGKTDRAVVEAHLALAAGRASPIHDASLRLLAQLATISPSAVRRSHERLRGGWLELLRASRRNRDTQGSMWRLQIPAFPGTGTEHDPGSQAALGKECGTCDCESPFLPAPGMGLGHPLFQEGGGGFGKSVGSVVLALETSGPVRRLKTWAARAQVDPRTITRWLWMLRMTGLVAKRGKAYMRGPATFDEVARLGGLDQRAALTRKQYEHERETYRERLAAKTNPYGLERAKVYVLRPRRPARLSLFSWPPCP